MKAIRSVLLIAVLSSAGVQDLNADGCFFWDRGADLREPSQTAVLYFNDGKEILVLQVKYTGPAEDFAWIVPLPSEPTVDAIDSDESPFEELGWFTQHRGRDYRHSYGGAREVAFTSVTVLQRKTVGVYDVAVLAADDPKDLQRWLRRNGYKFPRNRVDLLRHYSRKGWIYVAMRIDREALESDEMRKVRFGQLQPIRFEFKSPEVVYPLKISSGNAGTTEVLIYTLGAVPLVPEESPLGNAFETSESFPRTLPFTSYRDTDAAFGTYSRVNATGLRLTAKALGLPASTEVYVCKCRAFFEAEQMDDDLTFTTLDPVSYWKEALEEARGIDRILPLYVLAWHNPHILESLAGDEDAAVRGMVVFHPKVSPRLLTRLAGDRDPDVRRLVGGRSLTPLAVLREMAEDETDSVRSAVAGNPSASWDTLFLLVADPNSHVRLKTLNHPKSPPSLLQTLSADNDPEIRSRVARDPGTPPDVLLKFARDKEKMVLTMLAANPRLPDRVLQVLAQRDDPGVRSLVARRDDVPFDLLHALASDEHPQVRQAVAAGPAVAGNRYWDTLINPDPFEEARLSLSLHLPAAILIQLARDPDPDVRSAVVANHETPSYLLEELAKDNDAGVLKTVAANYRTPVKTLRELARNRDPDVSQEAKRRLANRGIDVSEYE